MGYNVMLLERESLNNYLLQNLHNESIYCEGGMKYKRIIIIGSPGSGKKI